jgi:hypothetical protein
MLGKFERATEERGKKMNLKQYFKDSNGTGVLASSSKSGAVDVAIYAKPIVT